MRLLYCIPSLYNAGGMERVITEKVNFLINTPNYEITILTTDQQGETNYFQLDSRVNVIHLNINFKAHFSYGLIKKYLSHKRKLKFYEKKLAQIINKLEIDICISLCGKEIEFLDKLKVNCKKVAEIHFAMNVRKQFLTARHNSHFWQLLGDIRTKQLKQSVKGLDKLVVLTKADLQQWAKTHKNVIQIPNPNPLNNSKYSLLDQKQVISVGKLDPQKGYDLLVEAWSLVVLKHPNWVLNIFGKGELKQKIIDKIEEFNLIGKVNLCGLTNNVVDNYLKSSIYVMSSRYEGLPMVLIEAMSCGLPMVSFDCEFGPREVIKNKENGFLIEPNNINKLADKICLLINDENLRKEMGAKSIESAKRFSKEKIMEEWLKLFKEI